MKHWRETWRIFGGRHPRLRPWVACAHNGLSANRIRVAPGNTLRIEGAFLHNCCLEIEGRGNVLTIGSNAWMDGLTVRMQGDRHVLEIGPECRFKGTRIDFEDTGCRLSIGEGTTIEGANLAVTENDSSITLGRDCMLAFGIDVRNGDSHAIVDAVSGARLNPAADIRIGDHVWIGAHAQILKGVHIGDGSVIGIRSVVTHSIPAGVVATGVPAREVRAGVRWQRERG